MYLRKVLISEPIHQHCAQILSDANIDVTALPKAPTEDELVQLIEDFDGLVVRSATKVTRKVIEAGVRLKIIGMAGTGTDTIDVRAATDAGVFVMNAPGGNTLSTVEHTCAIMLSLARQVPESCQSLKSGNWDRKSFMGRELNGKVLGIIGLGHIGIEVGLRMQGFGMRVLGADPKVPSHVAASHNIELVSLETLCGRADWISIHAPLLPTTRNMINENVFAMCKRGLRIVNVARGGIVKTEALFEALNDGTVAGAALDVFEEEPPISDTEWRLIKHPKVLPTPHLGANTVEAQIRVAEHIAHQFVDVNEGRPLVGLVNGKNLSHSRTKDNRLWMDLTLRLGKIAGRLGNFSPEEKEDYTITIKGSGIANSAQLLGIAAIVGIHSSADVNLLNAHTVLSMRNVKTMGTSGRPEVTISVNGFSVTGRVEGTFLLLQGISGTTLQPPGPLERESIAIFDNHDNYKKYAANASADVMWMVRNAKGWTVTSAESTAKEEDFAVFGGRLVSFAGL
ncbi:unnamed protein product [Cyprideis torosa]|uniref:Uncharacterized protein n=1 Tax=Cyprideis torosa TaxID=163714 RepID=A0A7R8ZK24_9CRUS|nr:unnamed protein product [Cyprideis torosa]CAG0889845.1 unnamed protein product [Cyprideis torosa]